MASNTPQSETFTIHYFAAATTHTSKNTELLPAPLPISDLFAELERRYPGFDVLKSSAISLNGGYVDEGENEVIKGGDEVAIIPPVSSG